MCVINSEHVTQANYRFVLLFFSLCLQEDPHNMSHLTGSLPLPLIELCSWYSQATAKSSGITFFFKRREVKSGQGVLGDLGSTH